MTIPGRIRFATATAVATAVAVFFLVLPAGAQATTLVPLSVEQLAAAADTIVVAEAEEVSSRPVAGPAGAATLDSIVTDVDLRVGQMLKGSARARLHLTLAGGKIGERGYLATWEPEFRTGERAIVFLDSSGRVMGYRGKLAVRDGIVTALGESVGDVLELVLGAEPLGPLAGDRPALLPAEATLPVAADSLPGLASQIMPATYTAHLDDDFESGTIDAGVWGLWDGGLGKDWCISTQRQASGSYSVYCDSVAPAGGPYTTGSYSWLWAGPMDLSGATNAFLAYDLWLSFNTGDELAVVFSRGDTNGDGFLDFNGFAYGSSSSSWASEQLDLGNIPITGESLIGEPQVWIAFIFTSDASPNTREGAYLDNIRLVEDPAVPVITDVTPSSASAGTNSLVTITGSGFGPSQGSGRIDFTYDAIYGTTIEAAATTWSDTEITCVVPIITDPFEYPGAAGSGPLTVTNSDGGTSAGYGFEVPFAYGGIKWPALSASYRLNANTADTASEAAMFDAAAGSWSSASSFAFADTGATTTNNYTNNGVNEVFWSNTALPGSVLAAAGIWYDGSTIEEVDVGFNDTKLWGDGSGGTYDIQTIAVHELGHALNLRDLYGSGDSSKIMYGYGSAGGTKRTLSTGDTAGIQWIYPPNTLALQASADPDLVVPGEDVLYTYQVTNTTDWPMTDVVVTDDFGFVSSTTTLAPAATFVATRTASFPTVGIKTNDISVTATGAGQPVEANGMVNVEVDVPRLVLTTSASSDPAEYGSGVTLRYRVRNSGQFTLSDLSIVDTSRGTTLAVPGTLAPGSTKTVEAAITMYGAVTSDAWARGSYASLEASDVAATLVISTYERLAGIDRVSTAVQASERAYPTGGSADTLVVASAYAWADALPASGLAGAVDGPLLLVSPTSLPSVVRSEISRLGASKVYIVGGTSVVSPGVESAIDAMSGVAVERIGGSDRFDTARKIAVEMNSLPGISIDTVFVATGRNFPDALAASSLAAAMPAPILLCDTNALPTATRAALSSLDLDTIVVCGGTAVVSSDVMSALSAYAPVSRRGGSDRYETARLVVGWGETVLAPGGPSGVYVAVGTNYPDALAGGVVAAKANGTWNPLMLTPGNNLSSQVYSYITSHSSVAHFGVMGGEAAISSGVLSSAKALLP